MRVMGEEVAGEWSRFISVVPMTGQGQRTETIAQEKLLYCEGPKQWNREVVESPFPEILKPHLDTILCNPLKMGLLYRGGWSG